MSAASVADLLEALRKSRFLDAARMDKVIKAQHRFADARALAKELVRRGWLTPEQAQALLQGGTGEPRRRRRGWPLALLALLLLGGAAGLGVCWLRHGEGTPANPSPSTEPIQASPAGGCSDTSVLLKTLEELEFGESARAKFDPKFLDALKDRPVPAVELYPWQPPNLVAVLGEHRMRNTLVAANPDGTLLAVAGGADAFIRVGPVETLHEKAVLAGHGSTVQALAWSPKGDVLASGSPDGTVRLWDVRDLEKPPEPVVLEKALVTCLSFSHDGNYLIGGGPGAGGQGLLWVWDVGERKTLHKAVQVAPVQGVAYSPAPGDHRALWGGGPGDGQLYLWDAREGKELAAIDVKFAKEDTLSYVGGVAFSPDGKRAVSAHNVWDRKARQGEWTAHVWDLDRFKKGQEKHVLAGFAAAPGLLVAFAPDNKTIATARGADGSVSLWGADGGERLRSVATPSSVAALTFLPRGGDKPDRLAYAGSAARDGNVHVHDVATGRELRPPVGHLGLVGAVAVSPDGRLAASGGYEGQARLWDLDTAEGRHALPTGGEVWNVGFHPDGRKAFYCGATTVTVPFVDVETGKAWGPAYDQQHAGAVTNAAVTEDGRYVLTGGYGDGTARLWSLKDGRQVRLFRAETAGPASVALSPTGKRALRTFGHVPPQPKDPLKLLHLRCQQVRHDWNGGTWNTFLPDGRVAILGAGPTAALFDVSDDAPKEAGSIPIDLTGAAPGAVSRDGRRLATVIGRRAAAWDLTSEKLLWEWTPPAHFGAVRAVALSDDGRYLLTANGDGTVYVIQLP